MKKTVRFRGRFEAAESRLPGAGPVLTPRGVLRPGTDRDAPGEVREFAADDLVRVRFDDDLVLWLRADDLALDYGRKDASRDGGGEVWDIVGPRARGTDRGVLGVGIRVLEFFGFDLKNKLAAKLGEKGELKQLGDREGLYRVPLTGELSFTPVSGDSLSTSEGPLLIFVHGTASSLAGSFGGLWKSQAGQQAMPALHGKYGVRAFGWEHRSLTVSPIDNALALAEQLPDGAELHLVTHSRGGLVGELLCLGSRSDPKVFDEALDDGSPLVDRLFAPDRAMGTELGLPRLGDDATKAHAAARKMQLAAFRRLIEVLDRKRFTISRFVRVACPARGTTLASGRLDRWLSVLNTLLERTAFDAATGGVASDLLEFVLAVVKERTDPRTLPGLEAMMPASPLVRLLNLPQLELAADLSVIAGDVEGDSIWSRLKLVVTDWFYGGEHDLVVNTPSMLGGGRRRSGGARYLRDQGPAVTHFNYFTNARTVALLAAGLTRRDDSLGGFRPMLDAAQVVKDAHQPIARSTQSGPRPVVVMLPGTMGSGLRVGDAEIWLHYRRLLMGRLGRLEFGRGAEPFKLVESFYEPLAQHLEHSHRVERFPYDWRHSVREAARHLADRVAALLPECERTGQPLRFLAHSMGGLVVRAFIAGSPELWKRVQALPGSRFMMLGTPNRGSHEAMRWLTGFNPTQAKLILLDITRDRDDIIDIVRRYPGLLELLPAADSEGFANAALWTDLRRKLAESWPLAEAAQLASARATWKLIETSPLDPERMIYVAGCQDETVCGYEVVDARRGGKALAFRATREGDGTVTWNSGRLPGVPTYYVPNTAHDAMCAQARAFAGYVDLLQTGSTQRLSSAPPVTARDAGAPSPFLLAPRPPVDSMPGEAEFLTLGFGGGCAATADDASASLPPLRVSIRHGDLAYARHPVMVGHYLGDSIVGAEKALDHRLAGKLSRQLALGLYPGALGSHAVFLQTRARDNPPGALIVGLGQVGSLSAGGLERATRQAMLAYAVQVADCPDDRFGPATAVRAARLSCLLVGTGAGGLPLRDALEAMLRGALAANAQLHSSGLAHRVLIDELEFVELIEDVAIGAAQQLERALSGDPLRSQVDWPRRVVEEGEGRRRRVRFDEGQEWWQRMEIAYDERLQFMRFVPVTDRARAEEHVVAGQLQLADQFIQRACRQTSRDADAAKTLFEMLLPNRLKELAPEQRDLVLLLDSVSARYPWELLEDRWSGSRRPPAVAAGLLRQLRTAESAPPAHPQPGRALVVGNPRLESAQYSDLPGAEAEARTVAEALRGHGQTVAESIGERADQVLSALHRDGWSILHLAGHGVHDQPVPLRPGDSEPRRLSGMVLGDEAILTPDDVQQMRYVPQLVFLNCCHLGNAAPTASTRYGELASNLALRFIRMGVRAVVAAGWAVNDEAARVFAERFYACMFAGDGFGEAVRSAREQIWERFPESNTWGAYQCYGDPAFRLHQPTGKPAHTDAAPYRTPAELVVELENLCNEVRMQTRDAASRSAEGPSAGDRIDALTRRVPPAQAWTARADVASALGFAYAEYQDYDRAIQWFGAAIAADRGDCSVRAIEQRANMQVRAAIRRWIKLRDAQPAPTKAALQEPAREIETAIRTLEQLCEHGETPERLNLLGAACKRLALILDDFEPRVEALTNMLDYYRRAQAGDGAPYAALNRVTAEVVLGWWMAKAKPTAARRRQLRTLCEQALAQHRRKNADDPDFWSGAGEADAELTLTLLDDRLDTAAADSIATTYLRALARGASLRERASLTEHLDFLAAMSADRPRGAARARALLAIRDAI